MDIVRPRGRTLPKGVPLVAGAAAILAFGAWGVRSMLHPAPVEAVVDRSTLIVDTARFGTLVRTVRATGSFAPNRVVVVAASADGVVRTVAVRPGAEVAAGATIAELASPELVAQAADLQAQIVAARAELASVAQEQAAARLDSMGAAQAAGSEREQAETQVRANRELHAQGLIGDVQYQISEIRARQLKESERVAKSKIAVTAAESAAKIAVAQAKIEQLGAQLQARRAELEALRARAGEGGIVQSVAVEVGQRLAAGAEIARIADLRDLKAVLLVPEGDAHGVAPGMRATIDTGSGRVAGFIARISPTAQNGSVPVDVAFPATPRGARPDAHVDATIDQETIRNAVSLVRPANVADDGSADLYKLVDSGARAVRVHAKFGRGSIDRVQILSGVTPGDRIVISDTSPWNGAASVIVK